MGDQVVIAIVVVVVVAAHVWLFRWVRFKIDEGVITSFLKESTEQSCHESRAISSGTQIAIDRVLLVCNKSAQIRPYAEGDDRWCIDPVSHG